MLALLAAFAAGPAVRAARLFAKPQPPAPGQQLKQAEDARAHRKYRAAANTCRDLLQRAPDAPEAARARFLLAESLADLGELEAACEQYGLLLEHHADGFTRDDILERQFRVARRLAQTRKRRWLFGGSATPERALPCLEKILKAGPDWPKAVEVQHLVIRIHEQRRDGRLAADAARAFLERYPASPLAEQVSFTRTRCLFALARGQADDDALAEEAWGALESFLQAFPASPQARAAAGYRKTLEAQRSARARKTSAKVYDEAHGRRVLTTTPRPTQKTPALQMQHADHLRLIGRPEGAADQYRALVLRWPDAPEAARAQYERAKLCEQRGRYEDAFLEYRFLLDRYPTAAPHDEILDRQYAIAERLSHSRKMLLLFGGLAAPERAVPYLEEILRRAPDWRRAAEARYLLGRAYESGGQHELAAAAYAAAGELNPGEPLGEQIAFAHARCLYDMARKVSRDVQAADRASAALSLFLQSYPDSLNAYRATAHAAALRKQKATTSDRQARQAYQDTHRPRTWLPFSRPRGKTPADQLAYALSLREAGHPVRAARHLRALVQRWPSAPEAATAQYEYARQIEANGDHAAAYEQFKHLMERYAGRFPHEDVLDRQFQIASRLMTTRKARVLLGGMPAPERAIPLFEEILRNGPNWARAAEAQYLIGKIHEDLQQYEEAIAAHTTTEYRYPNTPFAEKASFGRARCLYVLAQESPNDDRAAETAWAALSLFINQYPASEYGPAAIEYRNTLYRRRAKTAYDKAVFYDRIQRRPDAALITYRQFVQQFPHSGWTTLAEIRIQELTRNLEQSDEKKPQPSP